MSFGHFAAGFADAWADSVMQKREADRRDKMAKLQGELYELQIKQAQEQQAAQGQVMDMMTGQLGEFELGQEGLGEFNITPGQTPEFIPGRNEMPQLRGDREPMSLPEMMVDAQGIDAMMRAGYITPKDLIGGSQTPNRELQVFDAWANETDPERKEMLGNMLMSGGADSNAILAGLTADMTRARIDEKRRANAEAERTRFEEVEGAKVNIRNDFKHASEMIDIMSQLRDTALQTGVPFADLWSAVQAGSAAVLGPMGFDVREANRLIGLRQRLNKLMQDGIIEGLSRFEGTGGNVQNSKMEALIEASASLQVGEFPNIRVISDIIENNLDMAKIKQIPVDNEEKQRAAIEEWRAAADALFDVQQEPLVNGPGAVEVAKQKIDEIKQMTVSQIEKLDRSKLGPEERAALRARIAELLGE